MDPVAVAKELVKVERQIVKVTAILAELQKRKAEVLQAIGAA